MALDRDQVLATLENLTRQLLAERVDGHWEGELSSSALSTATATIALTLSHRNRPNPRSEELANGGEAWLSRNQNEDGGWGDTVRSVSNISTSALCWAALTLRGSGAAEAETARTRAADYMRRHCGDLDPASLAEAIKRRYGKDRTFSVPILTVLALAGLLGDEPQAWRRVPQLPFELAAFPQSWYRVLQLPVVSYALPALIAIGQVQHERRPTRNPLVRGIRKSVREPTLRKLAQIQPSNGGFLEAAPLTSFVTMSLIAANRGDHPVVQKGLAFLEKSVRPDGSWPIDTNLATWLTTLSLNALSSGGDLLSASERESVRRWLLAQQYRREHPYTGAAPGGWAWTDLPGGVPDADDTAGALLALHALQDSDQECQDAAALGVQWLLGLQNSDGGMPTFCRGWGALPFDRSSPDLTAHALRAWQAWRPSLPAAQQKTVAAAMSRAVRYLQRSQRKCGAWAPLWFGNQFAADDQNLTYGTARVLEALASLSAAAAPAAEKAAEAWLLRTQNTDGGWGGDARVTSSIEETALAVTALAARLENRAAVTAGATQDAIEQGVAWLIQSTDEGRSVGPTPIGFYFAKLWYFEKLYPLIFTVAAFRRAVGARMPTAKNRVGPARANQQER